jgi:hypothetical protein
MRIRFELNLLRNFFFGSIPKADAVRYWQIANRGRANLFHFELDGFYSLGRRRIAKSKATRAEMMEVLAVCLEAFQGAGEPKKKKGGK